MHRRSVIAVAALVGVALLAGSASASHAPRSAKLKIVGGERFMPGKGIMNDLRFAPRSVTIASGGTLTVVDKGRSQDPHTLTVVKKLPTSFNCPECDELGKAHFGGEEPSDDAPPKFPVLDEGKPGFDRPGDSALLMGRTTKHKISAASGSRLRMLCLVHPWMQTEVKVK